ncbi:universal stress protein [Modestobacter marinus]|uniref:universal stress protein n=1 Tax=Modestobacter marinus TaxID=477641 RepID=UPI001C987BC2|nr:universal stress protein [Modestobacter marinus]
MGSLRSSAVVAAVDGSPAATEAARTAALEADRRHAQLRLVHAFAWPTEPLPGLPDVAEARAAAQRCAVGDVERLRGTLTHLLPPGSVTTAVVDGSPEDVLHRESTSAALLVLGAAGRTWGHGPMPGSVAEIVVATAECPVLVHRRPSGPGRPRGVVAAVDGAAGTAELLAVAAAEARLRGAPLHVVHAWRQLTEDAVHCLRWRLDTDVSSRAERALVEEEADRVRRGHPGLQVQLSVLPDRAGHLLVQLADTAALLVVGRTAGRTTRRSATVHAALHRTSVPLLAVPVAALVMPEADATPPSVPLPAQPLDERDTRPVG